ncbi:MAG: endonuclease/exonuclease/phosphatase family protein [Planctomycetaceae bacterium]|nr:endonuclease/exonuclease/phosphatase family protein [Planctomycetaceae bacterium]
MQRIIPTLICGLLILSTSEIRGAEPISLRVLSYNIHHGEGVDGQLDLERIAQVMLSVKPDLIAVQEVDQKTNRTKHVDQAKKLAELTKMHVVFGPNIEFGGGKYGNTILSRYPIVTSENRKLPNHDRGEQRGILITEIQIPGRDETVTFISTHFDHRPDDTERRASAEVLNVLAVQRPAQPIILAGDLNDVIGSETLSILDRSWSRTNRERMPTVPVKTPTRQIDFILSRPAERWSASGQKVLDESVASDHRAFFSVLTLRPSENCE